MDKWNDWTFCSQEQQRWSKFLVWSKHAQNSLGPHSISVHHRLSTCIAVNSTLDTLNHLRLSSRSTRSQTSWNFLPIIGYHLRSTPPYSNHLHLTQPHITPSIFGNWRNTSIPCLVDYQLLVKQCLSTASGGLGELWNHGRPQHLRPSTYHKIPPIAPRLPCTQTQGQS